MKKYGRLLGSVILAGLLAWRLDWQQVAAAFMQLNVLYWFSALVLYLFTQGISAARWQMLGRMLGLGGCWRDYLRLYFVGMFFNLVLPTSVGGDVVRAWYLARGERRAGNASDRSTAAVYASGALTASGWAAFLSVLADRLNGLVMLIVVACMATLCCPTPLPGWIGAIVAGMGAACLLGLAGLPLLRWLRQGLPAQQRLMPLLDAAYLCLRDRRRLVGVSLLSLVVQLANVVLAWLVGEGLGLPVPPLYYGVLLPVVSILTLLPISLNGMGLREAGMVLLLAPLHVSAASAVTLSLLLFAVYAAAGLMGGVVYLFGHLPRCSMEAPGNADALGGNSDQGRMREPSAAT